MSQPPNAAANPEPARRGWLMVRLHRLVGRLRGVLTNRFDAQWEEFGRMTDDQLLDEFERLLDAPTHKETDRFRRLCYRMALCWWSERRLTANVGVQPRRRTPLADTTGSTGE
jgi:hypothetical protein